MVTLNHIRTIKKENGEGARDTSLVSAYHGDTFWRDVMFCLE